MEMTVGKGMWSFARTGWVWEKSTGQGGGNKRVNGSDTAAQTGREQGMAQAAPPWSLVRHH